MSKKYNLRTKLSDLEFVEELSDLELEAVAGGQALLIPPTGIPELDQSLSKLNQFLSNLRTESEREFQAQFPELTSRIFPSKRST